ncbi:serine protease [Prevotella sp. AGR2160]|uniref:S1 family peptidase n=1 Tax=Prevotella sp. AGR2160 TaxID=1280674 RepID=UPI0009DB9207|nr:serine protease [Prevotella sp. AGR2160]
MLSNYSHYCVIICEILEGPQFRPLGTGFIVDEKRIATAMHVVKGIGKLCIVPSNDIEINGYQEVNFPNTILGSVKVVEDNPFNDLCILEIENGKFQGMLPNISSLDSVPIGKKLSLWGFPHCTLGRRLLTYQEMEVGAKMMMGDKFKYKYATLNIQTRPGQSGSIVCDPETGVIVGVLLGTYAPNSGIVIAGINPYELNQSSYCISAEYILEML